LSCDGTKAARQALPLLLINLVADGEAFATFTATAAQDIAAPTVFHAEAKSMFITALAVMRLESSLHNGANIEKNLGFGKAKT
jgi:hypothetical protein